MAITLVIANMIGPLCDRLKKQGPGEDILASHLRGFDVLRVNARDLSRVKVC